MSAIFELSPTSRLLRQRLRIVPIGGEVSYADLSEHVAERVDGSHGGLQAARSHLLRHDRIVFSAVFGKGLRRLTDEQIVSAADQDIDGIRRKARRAAMKVTAVSHFAALTPAQQLAHTTRLSIFTAVASMASDNGLKKVEAAATASGRSSELPISETLKAFGAQT